MYRCYSTWLFGMNDKLIHILSCNTNVFSLPINFVTFSRKHFVKDANEVVLGISIL